MHFLGEVIAMLSGKGGTGKTAVCAGIATALAAAGKRVLCIDGDVGLRNLDVFLGMSDIEALSFEDVSSGNYSLSAAAVHPKYPILSFLTAPTNCRFEDIDTDRFALLLRKAREHFDYVFLDAPAGMGAGFRFAATVADKSILVTIPDPASIRCAERATQELNRCGTKNIRLVVNRTYPELLKALNVTIDDMMDSIGLPLLGVIPSDPNINFAAAAGKALLQYSRRGAAAALGRIAKRIQGIPVKVSSR